MTLIDPGTPETLAPAVREAFEATYGRPAAVVGRAPGRVNLIGEHTDYNRGLCLPVALPHATYAAAALREDGAVRLLSRQADEPWEGRVDALGPGHAEGWAAYVAGVVWALGEAGHPVPGLEMVVDSTVPLGAGLSSSAAVECAVAAAVAALLDLPLTTDNRRAVVDACIRAETEVAGAPTGGMDQTVAMLAEPGSALLIDFDSGDTRHVPLPTRDAGIVLLVTDTRVSHALVDGGYAERRASCERAAEELGIRSLREADLEQVESIDDEVVRRRARHVVTEVARVHEVVDALAAPDLGALAPVFAASHASMRDDFEISCPELDAAVATAVEAGALGARMTGGGFGGSSVAVVPAERLDAVVRAIDTAFAAQGFRPPAHLVAEPSGAAARV